MILQLNHRAYHQLLITVHLKAGPITRIVQALVDTGAQVNLLRPDVLPADVFRPARRPLALKTASGEALGGGEREAILEIEMAAEAEDGCTVTQPWISSINVHDGDVGVDLIIGYPWLQRHKVDVQPWRNTLQLPDPP